MRPNRQFRVWLAILLIASVAGCSAMAQRPRAAVAGAPSQVESDDVEASVGESGEPAAGSPICHRIRDGLVVTANVLMLPPMIVLSIPTYLMIMCYDPTM